MYIPKWFSPKELFPPEIASRKKIIFDLETKKSTIKSIPFDPRNWRRFDERVLMMDDQIRDDFGRTTGNENGLTECGIRFPTKKDEDGRIIYNLETLSQHHWGRGTDTHPKLVTAEYVRMEIIKNPKRYPFITFLEVDISWLHKDTRNNGGKLQLWSPKRGWVKIEEYLKWGDK